MTKRQIVAIGGGGFSMEKTPKLDAYVLGACPVARPKIVFLPTASGDEPAYIAAFYAAFGALPCEPSDLTLAEAARVDARGFLLSQDVIYVGGGDMGPLFAGWQRLGLDGLLREAWERGIVLAGNSAGALCWFEGGITDEVRPNAPVDCLGLLPGSLCVHYDGDPGMRPAYLAAVGSGRLNAGIALEDGIALHYEGLALTRLVASRPAARAFRVERGSDGVSETAIAPERL